ncbi:hypothetical protein ELG63_36385 [Rhizobium leguminosarum]|uniref:hypothetical protein n=1 Tax=Rhizobium leguminosarum TaxID=384 RepID=UPI0010315921|nr:hypothetical protein [Rhizobium leguminosarum]TBH28168.1 hypothetical protein ELG63_36385 [Rhizobium leguminosarum]
MQNTPVYDPKVLMPFFSKSGLIVLIGGVLILYGTKPNNEMFFCIGAALIAFPSAFSLYRGLQYRRYGAAFGRLIVIGLCLLPSIYLLTKQPSAREIASRNELHGDLCPSWFNMNLFDRYVVFRHRAWCRNYADQYEQTSSVRTSAGQSTSNLWK